MNIYLQILINITKYFILDKVLFWDIISSFPLWPWMDFLAEAYLELTILLPPIPLSSRTTVMHYIWFQSRFLFETALNYVFLLNTNYVKPIQSIQLVTNQFEKIKCLSTSYTSFLRQYITELCRIPDILNSSDHFNLFIK